MTSLFSVEERASFDTHGYVILRNAVPQENLDAVLALIEKYTGIDLADPEAWYHGTHPPHGNGMIELYQSQALWDNRQFPRVHQAFAELSGTEKLWVTMDRVNLKAPIHPNHPENDHQGFIHWDIDSSEEKQAFFVQGVLCLTDTTKEMGGFQAVPDLYRTWDTWVKTQPADRDPRRPDLEALKRDGLEVVPIPANAGDLIIWNSMLAHGNGQNVSNRPRLAQYLTMFAAPVSPLSPDQETRRQDRIASWQGRTPPNEHWAHGDPNQWEQKNEKTAELTPLGRKVLGLDLWD